MFQRGVGMLGGLGGAAGPGSPGLSQLSPASEATDANVTLTANQILSGWLRRSGATAGRTDTWPTADSIVSACLAAGYGPSVGDTFQVIYQNTIAFLITFAAGTGIIAGVGTLNVAASVTRIYLATFLSTKPQAILVGNNVNASAILTGFTAEELKNVMPGMGVTGTNVAAGSIVLGLSYGDGTDDATNGGKVTLDQNCTGTNNNIPFTFFPRIRLDSIGTLAA